MTNKLTKFRRLCEKRRFRFKTPVDPGKCEIKPLMSWTSPFGK